MKDSLSNSQVELQQRKQVFESAKKVRKHAKAAYEAELKAYKAHLKSFKQMYRHAVATELDAKKAYKALKKGLEEIEKEVSLVEELVNEELAASNDLPVDFKSPKAAKSKSKPAEAEEKPKKKLGRPFKEKTIEEAPARKKPGPKPKVAKAAATTGGDDLTKVKGVGDIVADMLKSNGISTYADMAATSFERYKELLKANGMSQFRNPTKWAEQASALAAAPAPAAAEKAPAKTKGPKAKAEKPKAEPKAPAAPARKKPGPKPKMAKAAAATTGGDDLTKVKGVGDIVADMLKANGISTYADMAATSFERYKELLKANGMSQFRNPTKWAEQAAALAAAPALAATEKAPAKTKGPKAKAEPKAPAAPARKKPGPKPKVAKAATTGGDDLTKVKGVGDIVADMLKANGISTYADMAATSFDRYKELLKANGMSQFRNPTKWAEQAAALAAAPAPAAAEKAPAKTKGPKAKAEPKAPAAPARKKPGPKPKVAKASATTGGDDLTKVKGVGDIVADMLKANGISTYADMAATSFERYKELLKANGMSQFRNPTKWAEQAAALAAAPAPAAAEKAPAKTKGPKAKAEKPMAEKKAAKSSAEKVSPQPEPIAEAPAPPVFVPSGDVDDLTKITGIGDRVVEVLKEKGIQSYADVAATSVERFKEILLENKMSRFRDPSKWPTIAAELMNAG